MIGGGGVDSSYSAEVEQVAEQENKNCDTSLCSNTATQTQTVGSVMTMDAVGVEGEVGASYVEVGEPGTYSAEVEQVAEQENKNCDTSACLNTATQTQTVVDILTEGDNGNSYSTEIEQEATQKNVLCERSLCENTAVQTQTVATILGETNVEGSSSAEIEQKAEQNNIVCHESSCTNNVVQTQIVGTLGGSEQGSYYVEQEAEQYNIGCFTPSVQTI